MPDVYVVGGRGYIGSRLVNALRDDGYHVEVIDPGYLVSDNPDALQDVTAPSFEVPKGPAPVVWCACVHRIPKDPQWDEYASDLMVSAPLEWLSRGHPVIYLSSMQVITQLPKERDSYATCKLEFEYETVSTPGVRVIRPGTVWGGLTSLRDPTNRVHTAINRYITTGALPDDRWCAYTTNVYKLISALVKSVEVALRVDLPGDILCVTDGDRPRVATDLERDPELQRVCRAVQSFGDWPVPPHPMSKLARARGLPWKE